MNTKEYLKQAKQLETLIYEQKRVVIHIQHSINNLLNFQYEDNQSKRSYFADWDYNILKVLIGFFTFPFGGVIVVFTLASILSFLNAIFQFMTIKSAGKYFLNSIILGAFLGLAFHIILIIIDIIQTNKYNENAKITNDKINKNNQLIQKLNKTKVNNLEKQLVQVQQNLYTTQNILNKLYSKNILHPKYRNFIAVCSIYEYFDTGRCTELLGHEGAYNIYENELRLNRIVGQLDLVIKKLDEIRDNQYALYSALMSCNRNLSKINSSLKTLSSTTTQIAESSEVSAYNSRITAQNTQAMKLIMMYDHV